MNAGTRLAVLTAMKKAINKEIDRAREEADEAAWRLFETEHSEKTALMLDGEKIGDLTICFHKPGWDVSDPALFEEFALDYGFAKIRRTIRPDMTDSVISALRDAGYTDEVIGEITTAETIVDADWENYITNVGGLPTFLDSGLPVPGVKYRARRPKGTAVTGCRPADVIPMLNRLEGGINALLLGEAS